MFTLMGFNTTDFNNCKCTSFVSIICSIFYIDFLNCVFCKNIIPGICGII